jgi:hypothetical protein
MIWLIIILCVLLVYKLLKEILNVAAYEASYEKEQMDYAMWKSHNKKRK